MNKFFSCFIALLLIPNLLAQPAIASLSATPFASSYANCAPLFRQEALGPVLGNILPSIFHRFGVQQQERQIIVYRNHATLGTATGGLLGHPFGALYERLQEWGFPLWAIHVFVAPVLQTAVLKGLFMAIPMIATVMITGDVIRATVYAFLGGFAGSLVYASSLVHPSVYRGRHLSPSDPSPYNRFALFTKDLIEVFAITATTFMVTLQRIVLPWEHYTDYSLFQMNALNKGMLEGLGIAIGFYVLFNSTKVFFNKGVLGTATRRPGAEPPSYREIQKAEEEVRNAGYDLERALRNQQEADFHHNQAQWSAVMRDWGPVANVRMGPSHEYNAERKVKASKEKLRLAKNKLESLMRQYHEGAIAVPLQYAPKTLLAILAISLLAPAIHLAYGIGLTLTLLTGSIVLVLEQGWLVLLRKTSRPANPKRALFDTSA